MRGAAFEATLLVVAGLVAASQALCRPGHTWWSPQKDTCLDCTVCDQLQPPLLVLRPCQLHQDTLCAPLGDLHIDWSWLRDYRNHRRSQQKKKHEHIEHKDDSTDARRIIWRFSTLSDEETQDRSNEKFVKDVDSNPKVTKDDDEKKQTSAEDETFSDTDADDGYSDNSDYDSEVEVKLGSEPFLSEDDFVWDWLTIVLTLAAFACVLFFIVVAGYSVHHAKQWRLLKKNLEADVEGLSAKLNLMMASADANDLEEPPSPSPENQYSNIRCAYLEQLLVGKGKGRAGTGNVYIQENNT